MKKSRLLGAVCACVSIFCSTNTNAVIIGSGDVYQQSSVGSWELVDVTLLSGGTIVQRSDGNRTWFLNGEYNISGGIIDTRIMFDNFQNMSISNGIFNDSLTIDRLNIGGTLEITGGIFNDSVAIDRFQGDVIISGGDFTSIFGSHSFTGGALPTATFIGNNWSLNGSPLVFTGSELDLTGQQGNLSGILSDGNEFQINIGSSFDPSQITVVNTVPIPAALWLFGSGLLGLVSMARRKKTA